MKKAFFPLFFVMFIAGFEFDSNDHQLSFDNPALEKIWETDTVLRDLESAIYDEENDVIYVTSINGHWLEPNGLGYLSKVDRNGNVIEEKWIEGLDGPTGTAIYDGKLFVADFNKVVEIDIASAKMVKHHVIEGTERINDLTVSNEGTIYGTGTKSGKLFALKNGQVEIIQESLDWPNGALFEKGSILVGLGDKSIQRIDLKNKKRTTLAKGISNPDGIVAIGNGDYLISSWEGKIHYVREDGETKLLLDSSKEGINAADICFIPSKRMVLVPAMLKHRLIAYRLIDEK